MSEFLTANISYKTKLYGLIGNPISHSLSPKIWNESFSALKLDSIYVPFEIEKCNISVLLKSLGVLGLTGLNITAPFKEDAAKACDELSYIAKLTGVVNCIKIENCKIIGWNTDALALLNILYSISAPKKTILIGNGATAKSAIWALKEYGINELELVVRREKKSILNYINCIGLKLKYFDRDLFVNKKSRKTFINTTPLNLKRVLKMKKVENLINSDDIFIDFNYSNKECLTEKIILNYVDGLKLLIEQADIGFKLFTGLNIPKNIFKKYYFRCKLDF